MKISDMTSSLREWEHVRAPGRPPLMIVGLLTIRTDDRIEGHNFKFDLHQIGPGAAAIADQIVRLVKPRLIDRDPLAIGEIWHELRSRSWALEHAKLNFVETMPVSSLTEPMLYWRTGIP